MILKWALLWRRREQRRFEDVSRDREEEEEREGEGEGEKGKREGE